MRSESMLKSWISRMARIFRRSIRPVVLAVLRALPSPVKCGCAARKEWMIKQIEAI
jgi:hypothetical protein